MVLSSESQPTIPTANETCFRTKRKRMIPRSEVWEHFVRFSCADGNSKCKCKYCSREFYCDSKKNGTSSLKNHMARCYKEDKMQELVNLRPDSMAHEGETMGAAADLRFDQEAIRKSLAYMIALDGHPFNFVRSEGFRHFMSIACPRFVVPSRWDAEMDCHQLYLDERLKLKNFLKTSCQRVSLTIDTRSSLQGTNYVCLTAHFIDNDWKLNRKILNVCPLPSEEYKAIGEKIAECLLEWGIDQVFTITVDSASSSKSVVAYLRKRILKSTILRGKFLHGKCLGHICNLIVADALKEMADPVARVRGAVKYVLQYRSRLQKLKQYRGKQGKYIVQLLKLDTDASWVSTISMLDVAQEFTGAFKAFEVHDPHYRMELESADGKGTPTDDDWEKVKMLVEFCDFFISFDWFQCSKSWYVTPYSLFKCNLDIPSHFEKWKGKDDVQFTGMVERLEYKYHEYWNESYDEYIHCTGNMNLLVSVAAVLDPSTKLKKVELKLSNHHTTRQLKEKVREITYALYNEYAGKDMPQIGKTIDRMHTSGETDHISEEFRMSTKSQFDNGGSESISELERYLDEDVEKYCPGLRFDILGWWKTNSHRFPVLSQIARDVLAVPINAVPSGYEFNTKGLVLSGFHSSLTPESLQAVICTENWLRPS